MCFFSYSYGVGYPKATSLRLHVRGARLLQHTKDRHRNMEQWMVKPRRNRSCWCAWGLTPVLHSCNHHCGAGLWRNLVEQKWLGVQEWTWVSSPCAGTKLRASIMYISVVYMHVHATCSMYTRKCMCKSCWNAAHALGFFAKPCWGHPIDCFWLVLIWAKSQKRPTSQPCSTHAPLPDAEFANMAMGQF